MLFDFLKIFDDEDQYTCYVFGKFTGADFVPKMLNEYGELCIDNPKLMEMIQMGDWTIIPCPSNLIKRGDFLNLMNWLCQEGNEAYGIAVHEKNSFFAMREKQNPDGDTVYVKLDKGRLLKWNLPAGLAEENPYVKIKAEQSENPQLLRMNCEEFLRYLSSEELLQFFQI